MIALRVSVLVAAFVVAAIALVPLRFAWAAVRLPADVGVQAISGTVWSGKLSGMSWRGVDLGDLEVTASATDRVGDLLFDLRSDQGPLSRASIAASSGGAVIENIMMTAELSRLMPGAPAHVGLRLSDGQLALDSAACRAASGRVTIDAIPAQGVPAFAGGLGCRNGKLVLSLSSKDGAHKLALAADPGTGTFTVIEASPAATLLLSAMGIALAPSGAGQ